MSPELVVSGLLHGVPKESAILTRDFEAQRRSFEQNEVKILNFHQA